MRLYTAPGFSSFADHIALLEAGLAFDVTKVDIREKKVEGGGDYLGVNPTGYVPALELDGGEMLTENVAILTWVADQAPKLAPAGPLGRYRLIEMLSFIATEIHKRFPAWFAAPENAKPAIAEEIARWLGFVAGRLRGPYLFGETFTAADAYLFVMARGAAQVGFALPAQLSVYVERVKKRPAVQDALRREGLGQG
jgi:glutathione S-transferase